MTLPRNVRDRIAELSTALSSGQWNASTMAETLGSRGDRRHHIAGLLNEINRGGRNLTQFATYNTMSEEDKGAIAAYQTNYNNLAAYVARYGIDRNELAGMLGAAGFNQHNTNDNAIGSRANDLTGRLAGGIEVERQREAQARVAAEPEHRTLTRQQRSQLHERITNLSSMMWNASALATDGDGPNANITGMLRDINHGMGIRHLSSYAAYNTLSDFDKQGLAAYAHAYNELANYVRPLGVSASELAGYLDQSGMSRANANDAGIDTRVNALEAALTRDITGTARTTDRPAPRPAARPAPARPAPAAPAVARDREEQPARPARATSAEAPEPDAPRVTTGAGSEPPARVAAAPANATTDPAPERPAAASTRSPTRGAGAPPAGTLQAELLDVGIRISQGKTDPAVVAAVEAFYRSTGERPMEGLGTLSETEITAVLNRMQNAALTPGQHDELRALGTALGVTMTTLPAEAAPAAPATPTQPDQPGRSGPPTR